MPRSPNDATRFTATGPYASTKPSSSTIFASNPTANASHIDFGTPPPNETTQQKIARLRRAAAIARQPKEEGFDRMVRIGRRWADRAHRATTLGLLGLTVVSALVATAGITDMVLHNRRRRAQWYAEQEVKRDADVRKANEAVAVGSATQEQLLLLNQERAKQDALEAKRNRPGMFKRAGSYLFGGLSKEEQKGGKLAAIESVQHEAIKTTSTSNKDDGLTHAIVGSVDSHRRQTERVEQTIKPAGGPLDRQAQHVVDTATEQGKSWRNWLTGR